MVEGIHLTRVSDSTIIYTSLKFDKMFGYGPGELVGKNISVVNAPNEKSPEEVAKDIRCSLEKTGVWSGEVHNIKKDGTPFWCHANVSTFEHPEYGKVWLTVQRDITERKRMEKALQESEAKYRTIVETTNEGIWRVNASGKTSYVNPMMAQMLGYTTEEMLGRHLFDFMDANMRIEAEKNLKKRKRGTKETFDFKLIRKDGTDLWTMISSAPIIDDKGQYIGALGMITDITDRRRNEEKIRLHEIRLKDLLELHRMSDAAEKEILDFTIEASLRSMQSEFAFFGTINADETVMTIHAWTKGAMEQCTIMDKPIEYPIAQAGLWAEAVRQRRPIMVNDYNISYEFKKGYVDGHVPIKRFLGIPIFSGDRIVGVAAVANKLSDYTEVDINAFSSLYNEMWNLIERKQAEDRYLDLFENAQDTIYVLDDKLNFLKVNKIGIDLLGCTIEEVIGTNISRWVTPESMKIFNENQEKSQSGEKVTPTDNLEIVSKNNEHRWIETKTRVKISDNGAKEIQGIARDITENRLLKQKLNKSNKQQKLLCYLIHGTRGGKTRALILKHLSDKSYNAHELSKALNMDYKTIRHHLKVLIKNGIIGTNNNGSRDLYFISNNIDFNFNG